MKSDSGSILSSKLRSEGTIYLSWIGTIDGQEIVIESHVQVETQLSQMIRDRLSARRNRREGVVLEMLSGQNPSGKVTRWELALSY